MTRRLVLLAGFLVGSLVVPVLEPAGFAETPAAQAPADSAANSADADVADWQQRLDQGWQRVERARANVEATQSTLTRARHRRKVRGDARAELTAANQAAQRELAQAEAAWPELLEEARRAGVPNGVLRDYEERR